MGLREYNAKRDFKTTSEPAGKKKATGRNIFVIQKHDASHLHYDFRLELGGVLKSWAVPKGPSLNPADKRLAMQVEDHPIDYARFEGIIPEGEYGGGEVVVWDFGKWKPVGDPKEGYRRGRLEFDLEGKKLHGRWVLVRTRGFGERAQWLLIKRTDAAAAKASDAPITETEPGSVLSRKFLSRDLESLGLPASKSIGSRAKVWSSNRGSKTSVSKKFTALAKLGLSGTKAKKKGAAKPKGRVLKAGDRKKKAQRTRGAKVTRPALGFVEPQLATLVDAPPIGDRWVHEIKYDGYRTLCQVRNAEGEAPVYWTRKGLDWSERYQSLSGEISRLPVETAILDGEMVVPDERGRSDFQLLQRAFKQGSGSNLVYYVFDLLEMNGRDLRTLPLIERKEILKALLAKGDSERVLYSDHWEGTGDRILRRGCEMGLEGVVSKDKFALYQSGRGEGWVKSKCLLGQEAIIAGYTEPQGRRTGFGSLVLAAYDDQGVLRHLGRVGTGFDHQKILEVLKKMKPLETSRSPFEGRVPDQSKIRWLKPKLVAEIFFHGWTEDGRVRQAVFRELRLDKPAKEVKIDRPVPEAELLHDESSAERRREKKRSKKAKAALDEIPQLDLEEMASEDDPLPRARKATGSRAAPRATAMGVARSSAKARKPRAGAREATPRGDEIALTNPEKVLIPEGRVTKRMVRDYLRAVAPWILPHAADRPLALVRCPDGSQRQCFFQKNLIHRGNGELREKRIMGPNGNPASIIWIDSEPGLESLAQMGTLEIHAWGTHVDHPLRPDLLVFDLDPDGKVEWNAIADAAIRIRDLLAKLGLRSFLKVSGNKGVHIHVPFEPEFSWEEAKNFAHALVRLLEEERPDLYVTNMAKEKRKGKIFLDYLRNGYGATSVLPYSTRKKNGGAVAMPIEWSRLRRIDPKQFTMKKAVAVLKKRVPGGRGDPWKDYFKTRQRLPIPNKKPGARRTLEKSDFPGHP